MVEFLVFSDAHFHDLTFQAEDTGEFSGMTGLNSRLMDCATQFQYMCDYAYEHKIKYVLFCGDLYHSKKMVSKDVTNVLFGLFQWAKERNRDLKFFMIPGNHDYVDKLGTNHSLIPFTVLSNVVVMDNVEGDDVYQYLDLGLGNQGTLVIRGIPYVENKQELIARMTKPIHSPYASWDLYPILLSHSGMQGAKVGTDFVMVKDHDLSVSDVPNTLFDVCLFGHYHEHQRVFDNGWIVGATHQMNWSDANGKRGFMHIKINKDHEVEAIHVPTCEDVPRFHELEFGSDFAGVRPKDFVKYHINEPLSEDVVQNTKGYIAARIGDVPKFLELIPPNVKSEEATLSEKAISADTVIDEWVEAKAEASLNKESLTRIGKELLLAARQKLE